MDCRRRELGEDGEGVWDIGLGYVCLFSPVVCQTFLPVLYHSFGLCLLLSQIDTIFRYEHGPL